MATAELLVELPAGVALDQVCELLAMHGVQVRAGRVRPPGEPKGRLPRPGVQLTENERSVLRAFACCNSNEEVAATLNVSTETVRWRTKSLYRKLRVNSRAYAVGRALRLGLLTVEDLAPPQTG
jgi:ATP/maltotriose-dependent transcriptional regulator MalT